MAQKYLGSFSNLLRQILKQTGEEFISLNDELSALKEYLTLQSNDGQKFTFTINSPNESDGLYIPPMFIQPVVENAIIHGFIDQGVHNIITVNIGEPHLQGNVRCEITDNGKGLSNKGPRADRNKSLSLDNIRQRLKIYGDRYRVETQLEVSSLQEPPMKQGTKVVLVLPWVKE